MGTYLTAAADLISFFATLILFIREVRAQRRRIRSNAAIARVLGTDTGRRIIYDEMGKPVMFDDEVL